jgi:hypothetical protein
MEVRFKDLKLDRLETDGKFDAGFSHEMCGHTESAFRLFGLRQMSGSFTT